MNAPRKFAVQLEMVYLNLIKAVVKVAAEHAAGCEALAAGEGDWGTFTGEEAALEELRLLLAKDFPFLLQ